MNFKQSLSINLFYRSYSQNHQSFLISGNHDKFAENFILRFHQLKRFAGNFTLHGIFVRVCFLFFLLSSQTAHSQYTHKLFTSNMLVEARFNYGFLYAHHLELEIFNSHMPAFEINLQQETYGKHKWERDYAYPVIGLSLWYSGLGKSPEIGSAYALFPYINFPLYRLKKFMLTFRFGLGLGYLTKKFDRIENYKNLVIGSHFNAAVNMSFEIRYRLLERLTLSAGFGLQHFSNGSLKLPNYGLNLPFANIGVAYRLARENSLISDRFIAPTEPFEAVIRHTMEFNFGAAIGSKNMQAILGQNFMVYHVYENTFFPVSRKSKVGFGLDLSYDESHVAILEAEGVEVTNKLKILRPGINAAYELGISKLAFIFNLGCYLGGQEKTNGPLYEKLSFQYNLTKSIFANVMLKVHYGRADYIGWGFGYRFEQLYGKKVLK